MLINQFFTLQETERWIAIVVIIICIIAIIIIGNRLSKGGK